MNRFASYTKTAFFLALLTGLLVYGGYQLGGPRAALFALAGAAVMNFASYFFSDKIVLALHRAKPLTAAEAPELYGMVERLANRANVPMPRLFMTPDMAPNAFATGRNPEHAVICVTQGIVKLCTPEELEGVLAHELSHVLNRDILISSIAATIAGAISLLGHFLWFSGGRRSNDEDRGGSMWGALAFSLVSGILASLTQLAISRSREFAADESGARLAQNPRGLAGALRKLGSAAGHIPMETATNATAHLYIVAPLSGRGGPLTWFMTHPPLEERIARLEAMQL